MARKPPNSAVSSHHFDIRGAMNADNARSSEPPSHEIREPASHGVLEARSSSFDFDFLAKTGPSGLLCLWQPQHKHQSSRHRLATEGFIGTTEFAKICVDGDEFCIPCVVGMSTFRKLAWDQLQFAHCLCHCQLVPWQPASCISVLRLCKAGWRSPRADIPCRPGLLCYGHLPELCVRACVSECE